MHWPWHNTAHAEKKKAHEKIWVFFRPRLDLAEISAKTQKHQLFHTKFVLRIKIVVPDLCEWRQCWRDKENIDTSYITQFATHQEILPKLGSIHKSSDNNKNWRNDISAMPRSILRVSIWSFNVVFEPHVHTNGKPGFVLFFHANYGRFCIFRMFISAIYLGQKKKKPGFPLIGWCIIYIV